MTHSTETFVRWYLRFNGYLGVENLIVHEPVAGAVPQGAEFDVVAVRFPFSREVADFELARHPQLEAIENPGAINVVIAEVKGGKDTSLNDPWRRIALTDSNSTRTEACVGTRPDPAAKERATRSKPRITTDASRSFVRAGRCGRV